MDERTDSIATGSLYSIGPFDLIVLFSFGGLLLWWFLKKNKEPKPVLNGLAGLKPISSTNNVAASDSNNFLEKIKISDDTKEPPDTSSDMELHVSDDTKEPPDTSSAMELYVDGKQIAKNDIVGNNFSNSHIGNVNVINDNSATHNHYHSSTEQRSISSGSFLEASNPLSESSSDQFCDVFDMMCHRIDDWQKLVKILNIENQNFITDFIENGKYNDKHEKNKICIIVAKRQSEIGLDWCNWRKILLAINENDLLEDIEERFPDLPQEDGDEISKINHQLFDDVCNFGIFAHHANRPDNFKDIPIRLKDRIKICIGGKLNKNVDIGKFCDIQKDYFTKYSIFEDIRKYDFSNINKTEECEILNMQDAWLKKNDKAGFTIKGYDAKEHLAEFSDYVYINHEENCQDVILTYSVKHDIILYINIAKEYEIKSIRSNCLNFITLRTANKVCLDGHPFIFVPVTLIDKTFHDKRKCKTCFDSGLIVSSDTFKDIQLLEVWWKNILNELKVMKQQFETKHDISSIFLRNIIGFKALATFNLPSFTHVPEHTIKEAQKIIMLTQEQQSIVYSKVKYKIIKGSFGSGKTIIAQEMIKLVEKNIGAGEMIFYLLHDSNSIYVQEMRKLIENFKNKNIIACKVVDFVKGNKSLSSILKHLLANNPGKKLHVFIEEFNGEFLDKEEVNRIKVLVKNKEFKNSHIVLVTQSIESERSEIRDKISIPYEQEYKYNILEQESSFQIFELSLLLRSSFEINNVIDATISILRDTVIKSIIPNFNKKVSKKNNLEISHQIQKGPSIQESSTIEPSTINILPANSIDNLISRAEPKPIVGIGDSSNNIAMDTDILFKHCSTNANKYQKIKNIESRYTYVGKREKAHNVKGSMPSLYYPFNKDVNSYIHQVFSIAEVLKGILKEENEKQVIICLNKDSLNILKDVLNFVEINWIDNPDRFHTEAFDILLTEYTNIRGCEFWNVILIYPTDEKHLKHNLVGCLSRCKLHLRVIVLDNVKPDKTLLQILEEWKNKELVQIYDENYLKKVDKLKLQKIEHLRKKDEQHQIFNMDDPVIRQSLQHFQGTQIGVLLHVISVKINNWKLFGRMIGIEENELTLIQMNFQTTYKRAYQCCRRKIEKSTKPVVWTYWKERLLTMGEAKIVHIVEHTYPDLKIRWNDKESNKELINAPDKLGHNPLKNADHKLLEEVSMSINNWKRLGRVIGYEEYELDVIEANYQTKYERLYMCITSKMKTSTVSHDWSYWKKKLLTSGEANFVHFCEHRTRANFKELAPFQLRYVLDIMCRKIIDWRECEKVLGLNHLRKDLEINEIYDEQLKNIKSFSEKGKPVSYWKRRRRRRSNFLTLGEKKLINEIEHKSLNFLEEKILLNSVIGEIENKYPNLLKDNPVDFNDADYVQISSSHPPQHSDIHDLNPDEAIGIFFDAASVLISPFWQDFARDAGIEQSIVYKIATTIKATLQERSFTLLHQMKYSTPEVGWERMKHILQELDQNVVITALEYTIEDLEKKYGTIKFFER